MLYDHSYGTLVRDRNRAINVEYTGKNTVNEFTYTSASTDQPALDINGCFQHVDAKILPVQSGVSGDTPALTETKKRIFL